MLWAWQNGQLIVLRAQSKGHAPLTSQAWETHDQLHSHSSDWGLSSHTIPDADKKLHLYIWWRQRVGLNTLPRKKGKVVVSPPLRCDRGRKAS